MSDDVETTSEETSETFQDIAFECPMCGKSMIVAAEGAGEIVMCPACDQEVIVPGGPLWDEVQAQLEAEAQQAGEMQGEESAAEVEEVVSDDTSELRERLHTMENQLRENKTQCTETAEAITQALNQATRCKLKLQRLEEKRRVLESMIEEAQQRITALERLGE